MFVRALMMTALVVGAREARAQMLSVTGSPAPMVVNTAPAGGTPAVVTDNSTSYTIVNSGNGLMHLTAQINSPMPTGVTLTAQFAAPSNAVSSGQITLSTTAQNVITSINNHTTVSSGITYRLSATIAAGVVTVQSRTVTLTLVQGP